MARFIDQNLRVVCFADMFPIGYIYLLIKNELKRYIVLRAVKHIICTNVLLLFVVFVANDLIWAPKDIHVSCQLPNFECLTTKVVTFDTQTDHVFS